MPIVQLPGMRARLGAKSTEQPQKRRMPAKQSRMKCLQQVAMSTPYSFGAVSLFPLALYGNDTTLLV